MFTWMVSSDRFHCGKVNVRVCPSKMQENERNSIASFMENFITERQERRHWLEYSRVCSIKTVGWY